MMSCRFFFVSQAIFLGCFFLLHNCTNGAPLDNRRTDTAENTELNEKETAQFLRLLNKIYNNVNRQMSHLGPELPIQVRMDTKEFEGILQSWIRNYDDGTKRTARRNNVLELTKHVQNYLDKIIFLAKEDLLNLKGSPFKNYRKYSNVRSRGGISKSQAKTERMMSVVSEKSPLELALEHEKRRLCNGNGNGSRSATNMSKEYQQLTEEGFSSLSRFDPLFVHRAVDRLIDIEAIHAVQSRVDFYRNYFSQRQLTHEGRMQTPAEFERDSLDRQLDGKHTGDFSHSLIRRLTGWLGKDKKKAFALVNMAPYSRIAYLVLSPLMAVGEAVNLFRRRLAIRKWRTAMQLVKTNSDKRKATAK